MIHLLGENVSLAIMVQLRVCVVAGNENGMDGRRSFLSLHLSLSLTVRRIIREQIDASFNRSQ